MPPPEDGQADIVFVQIGDLDHAVDAAGLLHDSLHRFTPSRVPFLIRCKVKVGDLLSLAPDTWHIAWGDPGVRVVPNVISAPSSPDSAIRVV